MSALEFDPQAAAQGFAASWKRVLADPLGFFASMPEAGGLQEPFVFLAVCGAIDALGHMLIGMNVRLLLVVFVRAIVAATILAAVLVLVAQHLFEGRAGFEPTFRVVAYAAAPMVFFWLPGLGILARLYAAYLLVRGIERVQKLDAARAVLTVAIGVAVIFFVGLGRPRPPAAALG